MKRRAALAVAIVVSAPVEAAAARQCLERSASEALITYAAPQLIVRLAAQCRAHLPPTAALPQSALLIAARYQTEADRVWPEAASAFDQIAPVPVSRALGQQGTNRLIDAAITTALLQTVKPADCPDVDAIVDSLQPLPARNLARLTLIWLSRQSPSSRNLPFTICKGP